MVLLAGFGTLLGRSTGQDDVPVGAPVAQRRYREVEGLIGFFVNTLVLRLDLGRDPLFPELLARVRQLTLEADAHQDVPFERLVEELRPERRLATPPLFQVMLAFRNTPLGKPELQGLAAELVEVETGTAKFDLTLSLAGDGEGLSGGLE
jgi:non-ribosomal peptide synthetase component F